MELKKDSKIEQNKNITIRQAGLMVMCAMLAFKVVLFPAWLGKVSSSALWLSYLISGVLMLAVLWVVVFIIKKRNGESLEEVLNGIFGKVLTKVIFFVLFVFFISKLLFFNGETKDFLDDTLYFNLNFNYFAIPILLLVGFLVYKGIRVVGRTSEIFVIFGLIILFISFIFSFSNIEADNFKTLIEFRNVWNGVLAAFGRAGDFLFLLIVMDKIIIKNKKQKTKNSGEIKLFTYGIFAVVLTTVFLIICELVLGLEVSNISDSIIKITHFTDGASSVFKLDGIIVLIWFPMLIIYAAINLYSAVECLKKIFGTQSTFWWSVLVIVITYAFNFLGNTAGKVLTTIGLVIPWLTAGIGAFVILLGIIVLAKGRAERRNQKGG